MPAPTIFFSVWLYIFMWIEIQSVFDACTKVFFLSVCSIINLFSQLDSEKRYSEHLNMLKILID